MSDSPDRKCPKCGEKIKGKDKYCTNCGVRAGRGGSYEGYIKVGEKWIKPAGNNK